MANAACIKLEDIENPAERGKYVVCIIGCGRLGLIHACLFAEAGFNVICVDSNQAITDALSKGKVFHLKSMVEPIIRKHLQEGKLRVLNDLKAAASQSEILVIAVPVDINEKGEVNYSSLGRVLKHVGLGIRKGTLVVVVNTLTLGAMEKVVKEILESVSGFKADLDFFLAYSPVIFPENQTLETLANYKRVVAASGELSLKAASTILKTIGKAEIIETNDLKAAEALALFETAKDFIISAFAKEFAILCEQMGVDYFTVQSLARMREENQPLNPSHIYQDGCAVLDFLLNEAESLNLKLKVSTAAVEANSETLKYAVRLVKEALKSCGKTLRRAKISIIGVSQTPNASDIPKSFVKKLMEALEAKGANINIYDPYLSSKMLADLKPFNVKKGLAEALEGADCIIISAGHEQFRRLDLSKLKLMVKMPAAIVDLEGLLEPKRAEAEGFKYRGFGRGAH